jgi:hypothetical protein
VEIQNFEVIWEIVVGDKFHVRVGILFACGKHLYDPIISLRKEILVHKISLIPPLFMEVTLPSQESERSCIKLHSLNLYIGLFDELLVHILEFTDI